MDWISEPAAQAYQWASTAPVFIQVALGIFLGLFSMTMVALMIGPRVKTSDMIKMLTMLETQLDSIYYQTHHISQSTEHVERLWQNSEEMLTALQTIERDVSDIETAANPSGNSEFTHPMD